MTDQLQQIAHDKLVPWKGNPRHDFDPAELEELRGTLATVGLVQPLRVRPHATRPGFFEIIAGERRWRANDLRVKDPKDKTTAKDPLPCIIRKLDDAEALEVALVENIERAALHPLDEAEAFERLRKAGRSVEEIAKAVNRKKRFVEIRRQYLERLSAPAQKAFRDGKIDRQKARVLVMKCPKDKQAAIVEECLDAQSWIQTADDLSEFLDQGALPLSHAIFDLALYKGPRGLDPDAAEEGLDASLEEAKPDAMLALDAPAFVALQREAVEARAKALEGEWSFCEVYWPNDRGRHFNSWDWSQSKDKNKAGAALVVHSDWRVKEHLGIVPKASAKRGAKASAKARTKHDKASPVWDTHPLKEGFKIAALEKTEALRAAMLGAEDPGALAMRVVLVSLLAHFTETRILSNGTALASSPAVDAVLAPLAPKLGLEKMSDHWRASRKLRNDDWLRTIWIALRQMKRPELERVFAAVVVERVVVDVRETPHSLGDAPLLRHLADELEVEPTYRLDKAFLESVRRPLLLRCAFGVGALKRSELAAYAKVKLAEIRELVLAITQPQDPKRKPAEGEDPDYLPPCFDFADQKTAEAAGKWNSAKDQA